MAHPAADPKPALVRLVNRTRLGVTSAPGMGSLVKLVEQIFADGGVPPTWPPPLGSIGTLHAANRLDVRGTR